MSNGAELNEADFLYGYLAEYVDGELGAGYEQKFSQALARSGEKDLPQRFQAVRGKLQLSLQGYYLSENHVMRLHELVEDRTARETQEALKIAQVSRWEFLGSLRRRFVIIFLVLGVISAVTYVLTPAKPKRINILESLGYEALALEEDPSGRIDLPTDDLREVHSYFASYPALGFSPKVLGPLGSGWSVEGATVLDYEVYKVALTQYINAGLGERLFHFSYLGQLADLPKAEQGNDRGLIYQTYATDKLNFVAWQQGNLVSFLIGRRSAPELAKFAKDGGG